MLRFLVLFCLTSLCIAQYKPDWASLDTRPLPSWYDESKFGIFIHWGVFSVPSIDNEWFWWFWKGTPPHPDVVDFMKKNYREDWTYADFASQFTAELFDPNHWADLFNASGAKYIVLTSKHHEGFTNWPSKTSFSWNSVQVGPKRDLVGDLAGAIRNRTTIKFGLYHSMFEWFNPLWLEDRENNFTTNRFASEKTIPELYELVNLYKPELLWSDEAPALDSYWNSAKFIAWLYNESPVKNTVVINDRWFSGCTCKHGGYYTCQDRYNPGHVLNHKWENCLTIDKNSWGYRRNSNIEDYMTMEELITQLASTVSCGGNMLLNVGPTADGRIVPIFEERLRQMGQWLKINGESIYSTVPWKAAQNDTITKNVWYTAKKNAKSSSGYDVYAIVLFWPDNNLVHLGAPIPSTSTKITMLGVPNVNLRFSSRISSGVTIHFPPLNVNQIPCQWAWVFKMTNLKN